MLLQRQNGVVLWLQFRLPTLLLRGASLQGFIHAAQNRCGSPTWDIKGIKITSLKVTILLVLYRFVACSGVPGSGRPEKTATLMGKCVGLPSGILLQGPLYASEMVQNLPPLQQAWDHLLTADKLITLTTP